MNENNASQTPESQSPAPQSPAPQSPAPQSPWDAARKPDKVGSLRCIVNEGSVDARIPVILCHGYGAPGDDLASLTPHLTEWIGRASSALKFVYPQAPHTLAEFGMPDGRAWWPLNMAALQELLQTDQFSQLHDQVPPGIDAARSALEATVKDVLASLPPGSPYVLGGFSQGAMLTMDLALRGDLPPPTILVQFSGTLVCQTLWREKMSRLGETHVLQSHGRHDPILPFSSAEALRDELKAGHVNVEFVTFKGGHTIETDTLFKFVEHLRLLVESTTPKPNA